MTSVDRFLRVVVSTFLAATLLLLPVSAFADFRLDSSFQADSFSVVHFAATPVSASLGTAFVTRAALGALGVEIASSVLDISSDEVCRAMWYGGGSTLPPVFTYPNSLTDYFSRETIRIRPGSVTIGGVEYSDVWLPHDAADKFRTNAFDFITRYNLVSESEGTFVSGVGTIDGIPLYSVDGSIRSSSYSFNSLGTFVPSPHVTFTAYQNSYGAYKIIGYVSESGSGQPSGNAVGNFPSLPSYYYYTPQIISFYSGGMPLGYPYITYDQTPFDFTWTSSVIPSEPLPASQGFRFRVPSSYIAGLPQVLDPESESYSSDISSLVSGVESSASEGTLTDPAFEEWDTPVPPASNTIANEPYSSLSGALSGISSLLGSISTSISQAAEAVISGDTGFFGNIVAALAAPFEPVFAIFRSGVGIWHYVVSWVGSISAPFSWSLSALGGAGSIFLSPIYAAAAGAVVLAVYKKFGR